MARSLKAAALGCAIVMMWLHSSPTYAQGACLPLAEFERQAYGQYKESPIHYGTASNGWTMTVWVSEGGATWTMAAISPDGKLACLLGDGTDWIDASAPKGKGKGV
ncbi:MAG: hypothetical protein KG075_17660 [Alphaproteobacteria bacterium]|nr:hypothetical protein [Alphaproteobacteria bacterium]